MYEISIEDDLKEVLKKFYKKNNATYEATMKKIEEIVNNPQHYKPLRCDMKHIRRAHIGHFVLVFKIDENGKRVKFLGLDHHDNIYKKRYF